MRSCSRSRSHERVPAQRRQAEQRERDVAQDGVAREQRDDLVGARHAEMRAPAAGHARDVAAEQRDRAAVGRDLAGDQVEQRGLAGAVRADDQAPLAGLDREVDVGGDAQAAEGLAQRFDGERGHALRSPAGRSAARPFSRARTRLPGRAPQPHRARHQPLRHEGDDDDEDDAEHQVPALDIGAHHVLHDDDDGGAGDRPEQRGGAAGDHHQQHLGRGGERRHLRADELVVVDEQQARRRRSRSRRTGSPGSGSARRCSRARSCAAPGRGCRAGWRRTASARTAPCVTTASRNTIRVAK